MSCFLYPRSSAFIRGSAFLSLILISGCSLVGVVGNAAMGDKVEAVYTPKLTEPLLVFAETEKSPGSSGIEAELLGKFVTDDLRDHKVAPLIDPQTPAQIATTRPADYKTMAITAVGKEVGAKQVLYVLIRPTLIENFPGSDVVRGRGSALIKLIDVNTGATLFPSDAQGGYPVAYDTPNSNGTHDDVSETSIRQQTASGLAAKISHLFYSYQAN